MQLKTLTLLAASLALAQAKVNGTWGDHTKAPVLDTTTAPTLPTKSIEKPVDGGKTDVADETVPESSTWVDADVPEATKPVDGGKTDVADATKPVDGGKTDVADETATPTPSYWGDETSLPVDGGKTDVADETASSTATWADETSLPVDGGKTDVADETASSTASYWGDASLPVDGGKTDVADEVTSSTTAHWSDVTNVADLTTTESTTVEEVTKTVTKGDGSEVTTVEVKTITYTVTVYPTPAPPKETPVLGGECGVVTVTNTVVKTITVPAGGEKPTGPPPAATTPVVVTSAEPKTWLDAVIPSAIPSAAPAPVSGGYMGIVQTWRSKMGLKALTLDSKLQSNAQDASDSSGGALKHKLNPGSMAQVMAPGDADNFESVFVGGWLCELPNTPGLGSSVCNEMSKGWNYAGQTGHAEILTSGKYSKIGCGLGDGIWTCDLA